MPNANSQEFPMTSQQLISTLGLTQKKRNQIRWLTVKLHFIGGGGYSLGSVTTQVSLTGKDGGFCLLFKKPVVIHGSTFLGQSYQKGVLYDVKIEFGEEHAMPCLSLASLMPETYPIKYDAKTDIVVK